MATLLDHLEAAYRLAAEDPDIDHDLRLENKARLDFFAPLAARLRRGNPMFVHHAEVGACMVLAFLIQDSLDERASHVAASRYVVKVLQERALLKDMLRLAGGENVPEAHG